MRGAVTSEVRRWVGGVACVALLPSSEEEPTVNPILVTISRLRRAHPASLVGLRSHALRGATSEARRGSARLPHRALPAARLLWWRRLLSGRTGPADPEPTSPWWLLTQSPRSSPV